MAAAVVGAAIADEGDRLIGLEEGMLYLPSQVLDGACDTKARTVKPVQPHRHRHHHHHLHHHRRSVVKFSVEELPNMNSIKCSNTKLPQRPKFGQHWASSGGHGMQAIFLDSAQKSCGTGVFLPQTAGSHLPPNNKKPACAPVLLPSRVVQALNLNVHALGLQISPRQDPKANRKSGGHKNINSVKHSKKTKDVVTTMPSSQCGVISQKKISSPDLFLPKEWTY
ncbi:uncharacterized protein LOC133792004 [Humulus lupulus]|uniref:uncharacterized protein LOC133792004 n=1 Tax=Humulus lupulus TaxID=3486 RepID=UPI002B40E243|nr:uncharacterized protein LOC133792004 [Humulus lupulus]